MTTKLTPIEDEMFSYTIDADHAIDNRDLPKALDCITKIRNLEDKIIKSKIDCIFKGRNTSDEYEARAYFSTGLKEHIGKGCECMEKILLTLTGNNHSLRRALHFLVGSKNEKNNSYWHYDEVMNLIKKIMARVNEDEQAELYNKFLGERLETEYAQAKDKYENKAYIGALNSLNTVVSTIDKHLRPFPTDAIKLVYEKAVKRRAKCFDQLVGITDKLSADEKIDWDLFVQAYQSAYERGKVPAIEIHNKQEINIANSIISRSNIGTKAESEK